MPEYRVRWEIEVDAETPREAVQRALEIHRDATSIATVFEVAPRPGGPFRRIDLLEQPGDDTGDVASSAPADAEQTTVQDDSAPTAVVINVSGGVVQDVFAGHGHERLEAIVVDWDTESCTPDENGIVAITNDRGDQQLADVIRHDCIPLAALEGTDVGNALQVAAGDKSLASLLPLSASPAVPPGSETCGALEAVPSWATLLEFAEEVARLLYADEETGRLTGENTLAARSGADFIDALQLLLSRHGITPRLEDA